MEFVEDVEPIDNLDFIKREDLLDFRKIDKYTKDIDKFTEEYLNYVIENYNDLKKNQSLINERLYPFQVRDEEQEWYTYLVDEYLEPKKEENNEEKTSVDKAMIHLEYAKQMLNEITTIIEDTRIIIEKKKIGTLEGITRQVIAENDIQPNENDVVAQAVLAQYYNELDHIKGGKNKRVTKTKKRKTNKKSKKSRKINN